jgi:hypothetical protein
VRQAHVSVLYFLDEKHTNVMSQAGSSEKEATSAFS